MQRSWRSDADKLTFIICQPSARHYESLPSNTHRRNGDVAADIPPVMATRDDAPDRMLGDINLFLTEEDDDDCDSADPGQYVSDRGHGGKKKIVGELEVMVARREFWGKGFSRAAVLLFMMYVVVRRDEIIAAHCGSADRGVIKHLRVKIHESNVASIGLFESLLFKKKSEIPNYFGEFELVLHDLDVVRVYGLMRTYGLDECRSAVYQYPDDGVLENLDVDWEQSGFV